MRAAFASTCLLWLAWASTGAAATPAVRDSRASAILLESAWAYENDVVAADCSGVGRAQGSGARVAHTRFRCEVSVAGERVAVAIATPLGPEWLRVSRVVQGAVRVDRGIGPIPEGRPALESFWAGSALQNSAWGKAHGVETAFCYGVGAFDHYATDGWLYFAFSCATFDASRHRGPQVLATVSGDREVRVVRALGR